MVPLFDFVSGNFQGNIAHLDQDFFNNPLRRDIVHNVFRYFTMKGRQVFKRTKTQGDVAGSGKKPVAQKGRGASRQGNRRAPQRSGGAKAHGVVPRDMSFPINNKLRL